MNTIVVLVGVSGAGKSTLVSKARDIPGVKILQPSTTRPARADDNNQYHLVEKKKWKPENFAWAIEARGYLYGIRKSQLQALQPGEIGLTVFHPGNLDKLHNFRLTSPLEFVTVGLDTIDDYKTLKNRIGTEKSRDEGEPAFTAQSKVVRECDAVIRGDAQTVFNALAAILQALSSRGVLDKQSISSLIHADTLLHDAIPNNIQPASYDLRVGETIWCKGELQKLTASTPVAIPPYSYVLVEAREQAHLPKFIVAHYDLKVSLFVQGIILSNGPQVDPGYKGGLLCMLFNGSDSNVGLQLGEHFATIEFLVTSRVTEGYQAHHQDQKTLQQFMESSTVVGPGGTILDRLGNIEGAWEKFRNVFIVTGLALVVALVVGMGALLRWGYDTWSKADESTTKSENAVRKLNGLIDEERGLKKAVKEAIQDLGRKQPAPNEPVRVPPTSAPSTPATLKSNNVPSPSPSTTSTNASPSGTNSLAPHSPAGQIQHK